MDIIDRIERLFVEHGTSLYEGSRSEAVSALEHALQCAQLAEWAGASPSLIAAALLHDVGHFIEPTAGRPNDKVDDAHEARAMPLLRDAFADDVVEPIRLHVEAKRYLVATDPDYGSTLSPASIHSLHLQGGPMSAEQVATFTQRPFSRDAVALRRWDDLAKMPARRTPSLRYFLSYVEEIQQVTH